jgi:hypothetical protein
MKAASARPCTPLPLQPQEGGVWVGVPAGSELAARFPKGALPSCRWPARCSNRSAATSVCIADGQGRGQPWVCITGTAGPRFGLRIAGRCSMRLRPRPWPRCRAGPHRPGCAAAAAQQLAEIAPWYLHNALVHYLAPRGLEQFSGGGWGTRDVCQGPLEMLLALDRPAPVRDLLLRVFAAQDVGGDWPQWFMFFERDRHIRAGDSHGDIVFWPLLGLARYLLASGDLALAGRTGAFYAADAAQAEVASVWQHVQRALAVIREGAFPARTWRPMAMATGTIRCSRPSPRCANACAAPGP